MTELAGAVSAPLSWKDRARRIDPRYLIAFLITLVLVLAQLRYHIVGGYERLAVALLACTVTEAVLSWFDRGRVLMDGDGASVVKAYEDSIRQQEEHRLRLKKQQRLLELQQDLIDRLG